MKDYAYENKGNTVSCLSVERLQEDSRSMVSFSTDEINLIYQFGENSSFTVERN